MNPPHAKRVRGSWLRGRRFLAVLAVVAAAGLLLRLGICFQLAEVYGPATAPAPPSDMWTYQTLARQVLDGSYDYARGFRFQPFYYTVFLPTLAVSAGRGIGDSGPGSSSV